MSKEQERAELHRTIWQIANDLRGSVDGWDFKNYVLGFLFYRFISEDLTAYLNKSEQEAGEEDFDYATSLADEDIPIDEINDIIKEKGYFIYPSQLFQNVAKNAENNPDLNIDLRNIFISIEDSAKKNKDSAPRMKDLFKDVDTNNPKLGATPEKKNELLTKIMQKIGGMDLGGNLQDAKIDAFGDAYEFLMTMYASNAGKSGGEFFTPQEVAELLARIACDGKGKIGKVYDPACGSGSLLLKFVKILGQDKAKNVSFYGQEVNITTYNLCRINMFLHHVPFNQFDIQLGDTLIEPKHLAEMPFDAIVSNPPYSTRWAGDDNPLLINDDRYSPAGVLAPKTKADLAFTMHMLSHLSTTGTAAIVELPSVLRRKGAEQQIRQYLLENNFVDTVIQLPENLFFGVSIDTCIIVLKKSKSNNDVLFIDASNEYIKSGNKNKLSDENIDEIIDLYLSRANVDCKSKVINNKLLLENNSNLSVSSYVEKNTHKVKINIQELETEINEIDEKVANLQNSIPLIIKDGGGIKDIIDELCPCGIKYQRLNTLLNYEQPGKYIVKSTKYDDSYATPVLTAGQSFVLGYTNETHGVYKANKQNPVIIFDDFTTGFHWVDFDFKVKSSAMKMLRPINSNNSFRYIYYAMRSINFVPAEHARHWISLYSEFEIPLPPLCIQEKIVHILDTMTNLKNLIDLQSKLRQKQYDYYRQQLLDF